MALKKKRAMCKKSCGSGGDAVEEVKLGEDDGGASETRRPAQGAGLVVSTDGFEQGGVRLVADLDIEGQFVEDDGGRQKQEDPLRERVLWCQPTALSKAA
jgi:hypothetical protein